jgi:hypothetical protein
MFTTRNYSLREVLCIQTHLKLKEIFFSADPELRVWGMLGKSSTTKLNLLSLK